MSEEEPVEIEVPSTASEIALGGGTLIVNVEHGLSTTRTAA